MTSPADPTPALIEIDARGLRCPLPVIALAHAVRANPGRGVLVLATDPAARADIPAWGRMTGHELTWEPRDEHDAYLVAPREKLR